MPVVSFLAAVAWWPGIFGAPAMPRWWVVAVGLPLASRLDPRALRPDATVLLALGAAWAAVTWWWTPWPHAGALQLYEAALVALAMIASACLEDADVTLAAMGWGLAVSSALALLQMYAGWSPVPVTGSVASDGVFRPSPGGAGLFFNPGIFAETAAPVFVWAALSRRWWLAAALLVPVLLCHSRIAAACAAVGILAAWRPDRGWARPAALVVVAVAALAGVSCLGPGYWGAALDRMGFWLTAAYSIVPLGRGVGWWQAAHSVAMQDYAHSDLVQGLVEMGVGAVPLVALAVLLAIDGGGKIEERCAYVAACAAAVVSFPLHMPASGLVFGLLAGRMARGRGRVRALRPAGGAAAGGGLRPGDDGAGVPSYRRRCGMVVPV